MKKLILISILISLLIMPAVIFAVDYPGHVGPSRPGAGRYGTGIGQEIERQNIGSINDLFSIIERILTWLAAVIGIVAVFIFLYAGFLFMMSGGDEGKLKDARNYVIYAVVGGVVAALSWSATTLINSLMR